MAGLNSHVPAEIIIEELMESSETDSYGEWVIRKLQQEVGGDAP